MIGTSGPSISMMALSTPRPAERGEHVLGGRAERAGGVAEHGGEFGGGDGADIGANFAIGLAVDAAADEHDAGVGFGRKHGERGRQPGMNANAADRGLIAKRGLLAGFHAPFRTPVSPDAREACSPIEDLVEVPRFRQKCRRMTLRLNARRSPPTLGENPLCRRTI